MYTLTLSRTHGIDPSDVILTFCSALSQQLWAQVCYLRGRREIREKGIVRLIISRTSVELDCLSMRWGLGRISTKVRQSTFSRTKEVQTIRGEGCPSHIPTLQPRPFPYKQQLNHLSPPHKSPVLSYLLALLHEHRHQYYSLIANIITTRIPS